MTSRSSLHRDGTGSQAKSDGGFTLMEMLVVVAVMGLILSALAVYGPPKDRALQMKGAAQAVARAMIFARGQAIATGAPVAVALPPPPAWLAVRPDRPAIYFEPDGSSTGGVVALSWAGRGMTVSADWLTGRVSVAGP